MTKTRRDRRKAGERERGGHTVADHVKREDPAHKGHFLPVRCETCSPRGKISGDTEISAVRKTLRGPRDWSPPR